MLKNKKFVVHKLLVERLAVILRQVIVILVLKKQLLVVNKLVFVQLVVVSMGIQEFVMMESLKQLWWQEAASFLDVPSGPDEVRRRAMMRSILTSDSPTRQGVPEFAPLEAQGLFNSLLNDTPWSLNTPPVSDSPEVPDIV